MPRAGADDVTSARSPLRLPRSRSGRRRAPRERGEVLRRTFELMIERKEELAFLMSLEMGKSLTDARGEVVYAAEFFRWFAEEAVRIGGELRTAPSGANRILTFRKPVGVALLLTPWNFPAAMATRKIGPALAAGLHRRAQAGRGDPADRAAARVAAQPRPARRAGVVNVLTTDKPGELVDDGAVRRPGAQAVVHRVDRRRPHAAQAGRRPHRQLSRWNSAATTRSSCSTTPISTPRSTGAMLAKMRNGGQACTAANRFLVQESVAAEFAGKLAERDGRAADGRRAPHEDTQLGPMINARAVDGIADKVDRSVAAGASVVLGGSRPSGDGFFYPATVLTDVPRDSAVATEEVFGPVAPIIRSPTRTKRSRWRTRPRWG